MSTIIMVRGAAPIDVRLNIAATSHLQATARGDFPYLTMATDYDTVLAECERLSLFAANIGHDFTLILVGGIEGGFKTVAEVRPIAELAMQNEWAFGTLDNNTETDIENTDGMIFELQDQYGGRDAYEYTGGDAFGNQHVPIIPRDAESKEG